MEVKNYPKITNAYDQKFMFFVTEQMRLGLLDDEWVVQETLHGANFAFYCDGENILCAKHSGCIGDDENFFNYTKIADYHSEKIKELFRTSGASKEVVVCGGLFGGVYSSVESSQDSAVQRGIQYHPSQQFLAFDLYIDGKLQGPEHTGRLFYVTGIPRVKALEYGTLKECLAYNNTFKSTIPSYYNLPPVDEDNYCEGVVIKPMFPAYLPTGERVIFKNKNETRAETSKLKHRPPAIPVSVPDDLLAMITENRLTNVISHIGEVTIKDFSTVIQAYVSDIFSEYGNLEMIANKQVRKVISARSAPLIRDYFMR